MKKLIKQYPGYILLILGILIYGMSIFNGFVWDDVEQVVNNTYIRSLTNIPYFFTQSTFNTGGGTQMSGMYYKPLMPALFSVIHVFSGLQAWGYHLIQFLLHSINSVLIYSLFTFFMPALTAFFLSVIFLVHPGNVETVAYISGLQDVLFMFFGLLAFKKVVKTKQFSLFKWIKICGLLFLSILSKETGILFILTIFVYLLLFNKKELADYIKIIFLYLCLYAIMRFAIAGVGFNQNKLSPIMLASFPERLISIPRIILFYVGLIFFPKDLAISQHWVVSKINFLDFYLPLIIITGFTIILISNLWRLFKIHSKHFKCGLFFFILFIFGILMHSQIIALDLTVSERWLYFPLFAFLGFLGVLITGLKLSKKMQQILLLSSLILIILFSLRTFVRILNWKDGYTLFTHDEPLAKNNYDFENNLGVYLFLAGEYKEAKKHFLKSVDKAPHWWTNWNNLGVIMERENQLQKAKTCYLKAINHGDYYLAYENYPRILIKEKKYKKAKTFLETKALLKFPNNQKLRQMYLFLNNN